MSIDHLFSDLLPEPTPIHRAVEQILPSLIRTPSHHSSSPVPPRATTSSTGLPPRRMNPWQRAGTTLLAEATVDPDIAIIKAGLDWDVQPVDLRTADTLDPVPDVRAIRRTDTKAILGVVGPDYTTYQNRQVFNVFRDLGRAAPGGKSVPFTIETAGSFQKGAVVWVMAHLPDLGIRIGDDESKTYLFISTGHVSNKMLTIAATTYRIICSNTLRMAEAQARSNRGKPGLAGGFTVKHLPGMQEAVHEVQEAYAATIRSHLLTKQAWEFLAGKPLTSSLKDAFLGDVFGRPGPDEADRAKSLRKAREERIAAILASPTSQVKGTKDSAFSLMQAVVEWADHDRSTRTAEGGDAEESRLFSATFGSGAELKAKGWDAILALTGA